MTRRTRVGLAVPPLEQPAAAVERPSHAAVDPRESATMSAPIGGGRRWNAETGTESLSHPKTRWRSGLAAVATGVPES